jgi:hypothetical protein
VTGKTPVTVPLVERRPGAEFAAPEYFVRDVPTHTKIGRRVEKFALQRSDGSINDPLALAGNAGQRGLGGLAKSRSDAGAEWTG